MGNKRWIRPQKWKEEGCEMQRKFRRSSVVFAWCATLKRSTRQQCIFKWISMLQSSYIQYRAVTAVLGTCWECAERVWVYVSWFVMLISKQLHFRKRSKGMFMLFTDIQKIGQTAQSRRWSEGGVLASMHLALCSPLSRHRQTSDRLRSLTGSYRILPAFLQSLIWPFSDG